MVRLVAKHQKDIQDAILEGVGYSWQQNKANIGKYTKSLQDKVMALEDAVNGLMEKHD